MSAPVNHEVVATTDEPMDARVDRRSFLHRASALAAATTVGTVALPAIAYAGPKSPPAPSRPLTPRYVPRRSPTSAN